MSNCFEHDKSPSFPSRSTERENNEEGGDEDEETSAMKMVTPA